MTPSKEEDRLSAELDAALALALAPVAPPERLRARVLARVQADTWRPVGADMQVKTLYYDEAARMVSFLLRAQPGASMPAHVHHAVEECLVLEGEFALGDRILRVGDFEIGRVGQEHPMATTRTGVLVYIRGAVEDYPFAVPGG
jgi:anti-sigma factor ChrR (cupin superfamily)